MYAQEHGFKSQHHKKAEHKSTGRAWNYKLLDSTPRDLCSHWGQEEQESVPSEFSCPVAADADLGPELEMHSGRLYKYHLHDLGLDR